MKLQKKSAKQRQRRGFRVRNRVRATGRLRLSVFRSNQHVYAQVIDDETGRTLVSASSKENGFSGPGSNIAAAAAVGKAIGERAVAAGIKEVAFDRGSYRYHGRIAALANAAREAGLNF